MHSVQGAYDTGLVDEWDEYQGPQDVQKVTERDQHGQLSCTWLLDQAGNGHQLKSTVIKWKYTVKSQ